MSLFEKREPPPPPRAGDVEHIDWAEQRRADIAALAYWRRCLGRSRDELQKAEASYQAAGRNTYREALELRNECQRRVLYHQKHVADLEGKL
jgi:hypothetical protein